MKFAKYFLIFCFHVIYCHRLGHLRMVQQGIIQYAPATCGHGFQVHLNITKGLFPGTGKHGHNIGPRDRRRQSMMCLLAEKFFLGYGEQPCQLTIQLLGVCHLPQVSPIRYANADRPFVFVIIYITEKL